MSLPLSSQARRLRYHPEASPGPHDAAYLFDCFRAMMDSGEPVGVEQMHTAQRRLEQRLMNAGQTAAQ